MCPQLRVEIELNTNLIEIPNLIRKLQIEITVSLYVEMTK